MGAAGGFGKRVRSAASGADPARIEVDDGVSLAVIVAGSPEAPGLLLSHGFGGAKEDFADHLDALAREFRVVAFDHRGHGESDAPGEASAYSFDRLAADMLAIADACDLDRFGVLGHSMGGMVARRLVLARPDRVASLVLMDTSAGPPASLDPDLVAMGLVILEAQGMQALKRAAEELDLLGSEARRRVLASRPEMQDYLVRRWEALSPVMWATLIQEIVGQPDQLAELRTVRCPTLVLVGAEDVAFLESSRVIADAIPGARLAVIPDAGHSPQFESPLAWRRAVVEFLGSPGGQWDGE